MKISRQDPYRRRRSPLSLIIIVLSLLVLAVLALAWVRGGPQPAQTIETPIASERLGS